MKLSKKEWKTVTNILFVFPITVVLFLIKGTIGIVIWIIGAISNSQNGKAKTSKQTNRPKMKSGIVAEPSFQDRKIAFAFICIVLLIIVGIILVMCIGSGDNTKYTEFAFNEIEGGYKMTQSYKLFSPNYEGELVIPETYNGKPVIEIDSMSSWFGRGITKLIGSKNLMVIRSATLASRDQSPMPNMTEVIFPADGKLKSIETHAFYWQTSLKTVILPREFEQFEAGVFDRCYYLQNLVIYNPTPPIMEGNIFVWIESSNDAVNTHPHPNFTVFVPDEAVETYEASEWGKYNIKPISTADFIK